MSSQWEFFLKNLGEWHGSFTRVSLQGEVITNTPTIVTLEGLNDNRQVHQVVRYLPPGEAPRDVVVDYDSLNRSIIFFANGAFSQGSMQWGPYSTFGGEFGLIDNEMGDGSRRLRMVELFNSNAQLERIVLIREKLPESAVSERPPLRLSDLLGEWQGQAVTMYADLRPSTTESTYLQICQQDSEQVTQTLTFGNQRISSQGRINGSQLIFDQSGLPMQVLMLADGASCTCPLSIQLGHNYVLEMGWLITPQLRQRIMRSYNAQGNWVGCTLVTERKLV